MSDDGREDLKLGEGTPEGEANSGREIPEELAADVKMGESISRRIFLKILAALGLSELAGQILGSGKPSDVFFMGGKEHDGEHGGEQAEHEQEIQEFVDKHVEEIVRKVEANSEGLSDREKFVKAIDYAGVVNFLWGIKDLTPFGKGHISAVQYGIMLYLNKMKYNFSDEEGKHHLIEEIKANAKAFGIIAGTIVVGKGMEADLETMYREIKGQKADLTQSDKIALVNWFATVLSPTATTVGSSSIIQRITNELADTGKVDENGDPIYDEKIMAVCVSHVSNLSGFVLFGDPPFVAVVEKFGFAEGVIWQLSYMAFPAIYSLFSSTFKLNYSLARKNNLSKKAAVVKASKDTLAGLWRQLPVVIEMMWNSLLNAAKYFGPDLSQKLQQKENGIKFKIGDVIESVFKNISQLPFKDKFPSHEGSHGMIFDAETKGKIQDIKKIMEGISDNFISSIDNRAEEKVWDRAEEEINNLPEDIDIPIWEVDELMEILRRDERDQVIADMEKLSEPEDKLRLELFQAIDDQDWSKVIALGEKLGISGIEFFVQQLEDCTEDEPVVFGQKEKEDLWQLFRKKMNPLDMWKKTLNVPRLKDAAGHNLADVINVFPFQAGSVPFLITVFKDALNGLESLGMTEMQKEWTTFFMIMFFSMLADNYVGCKIGLELMPEKPHVALIAAIQGGSMTSIGNMANVAQFDLQKFPLAASLRQMGMHIDTALINFGYSNALSALQRMGFDVAPKLKGATDGHGEETDDHEEHAANDKPEDVEQTTRREFFENIGKVFKPKEDQAA
jgi:hypothetical protein